MALHFDPDGSIFPHIARGSGIANGDRLIIHHEDHYFSFLLVLDSRVDCFCIPIWMRKFMSLCDVNGIYDGKINVCGLENKKENVQVKKDGFLKAIKVVMVPVEVKEERVSVKENCVYDKYEVFDLMDVARRQLVKQVVCINSIVTVLVMGEIIHFKIVDVSSEESSDIITLLEKFYQIFPETYFSYPIKLSDKIFDIGKWTLSSLHSIGSKFDVIFNCSSEILKTSSIKSNLGSILVHGVAGVGKSTVLNAVSTCFGGKTYTFTGPDVIVHMKQIERLFLSKNMCLIIIDDADILFSKISEMDSILGTLISLLDTKPRNIQLILAVRELNVIPISMRRAGRFEYIVCIPIPTRKQREQILNSLYLELPVGLAGYISSVTPGFVARDLVRLGIEAEISRSWNNALKKIKASQFAEFDAFVPSVTWDDIAGQEHVKSQLHKVLWQWTHSDKLKQFGVSSAMGVCLVGGEGKTLLAHAMANTGELNVIEVKANNIFSKYFGDSEANIRNLFLRARQMAPCIILIDNIELIGGKRGRDTGDSGVQERVLSTLLNEMDGITANLEVYFICTSSSIELVDSALLRPGRIEIIIDVPPIDADSLRLLANRLLQNFKFSKDSTPEKIVSSLIRLNSNIKASELKLILSNISLRAIAESEEQPVIHQKLINDELKDWEENQLRKSFLKPLKQNIDSFTFEVKKFDVGLQ